jgi:hypothetical protein
MQKLTLAAAVALIALSEPAAAQLVPVEWDAAGQFSKEVPIAAGKFVEVCERFPQRARVAWSFDAAAPLDFNIHYHEGDKVRFPARKNQVAKDAGTMVAKIEQDYCWMWTNKASAETTLRFTLAKH